ncbi:MAG: hypothetical protein LBQ69_06020 [Treponema sp.]|nr:hypothetical protein [Treponema sp.]
MRVDISGQYLPTVKRDANSYEELINKGSISLTEFVRFGNNRYFEMEIDLYTLQKYNTIKIHSLEFEFDGQKKIINVNRTIRFDINYSLDKGEVITQEDNYLVSIAKTRPIKTDLAYRLYVLKERFLRRR